MPVSLSAKLSSATGNQISYGSDNGLFAPAGTATSNTVSWTIDNYFSASGATWWYQMMTYSNNQFTQLANLAQVWPVIFARPCRIADAEIYVQTAAANSALYCSLYSSTGPNKMPGPKVSDLFRFPTTATGIARAAAVDTTTVFAGQTLYWVANWTNTTGALPSLYTRTMTQGIHRATAISGAFASSGGVSTENTQGWSSLTAGPATLASVTQPGASQAGVNLYPPMIMWALTTT